MSFLTEFFHSHHIDYQELIEKGLAIDCTNLNIYWCEKIEYQEVEYSTYLSPEKLNKEGIDGWELSYIFTTKNNILIQN